MVCLIKMDGARIVSWVIGRTLGSVALHYGDAALTIELLSKPERYSVYGNYQLQDGKYTLLVGSIDAPPSGSTND